MRRGVTLLELLVVLALMGVLVGVAAPSARYYADRVEVEHQAARILSAYRSAWLTARSQHRLALLRVTRDTLAIHSVVSAGSPDTTLVWMSSGPDVAGVTLTSPAHTTVFGPDGVAMGLSNATHRLQKGDAKRQVVVSRLGRVRIVP